MEGSGLASGKATAAAPAVQGLCQAPTHPSSPPSPCRMGCAWRTGHTRKLTPTRQVTAHSKKPANPSRRHRMAGTWSLGTGGLGAAVGSLSHSHQVRNGPEERLEFHQLQATAFLKIILTSHSPNGDRKALNYSSPTIFVRKGGWSEASSTLENRMQNPATRPICVLNEDGARHRPPPISLLTVHPLV